MTGTGFEQPAVSVITVVYNDVEHIEETLRSVLEQTYGAVEYHVVDGGSTDGTVDVIQCYASRLTSWVSEPDRGIYDAMNKGIQRAREGTYLNFLNSGDVFCSRDVLQEVFTRPEVVGCGVVFGDVINVYPDGSERYNSAAEFSLPGLLERGTAVVCHQAMFVRRDVSPLFDSSLFLKGELNWYFDLVDNNPELQVFHVDVPIIRYRIGGLGYQRFITNRLEWLKVVYHRYGLEPFGQYHYPQQFLRSMFWRYPRLKAPLKVFSRLRGRFKGAGAQGRS